MKKTAMQPMSVAFVSCIQGCHRELDRLDLSTTTVESLLQPPYFFVDPKQDNRFVGLAYVGGPCHSCACVIGEMAKISSKL